MTIENTYPIHRCVYRNDEISLRELLKDEKMKKRIDEKDNHGNTPIHLAIMLDRRNCILTLLNNGCDPITRNTYNWNPLDEAIMLGDIDIVEKITIMKLRDYAKKFAISGGKLEQWNSVLPNVYLKIKLKCKSQVPIISKICPKDTLHFYKKGNFLRLDTSITGFDTRGIPRIIKGDVSIIAKFKIDGMCRIILLDNKKKVYQELYPEMPQWLIGNLLKSNISIKTLYKVFVDTSNFIIKQKKNRILKKTKRTVQMDRGKSYKADLFKAKDIKLIIRKRTNESTIGDRKSDIKTKIINVQLSRNKTMKRADDISFIDTELISKKLMNIEKTIIGGENNLNEVKKAILNKRKSNLSRNDSDDDDSDDDSDDDFSTVETVISRTSYCGSTLNEPVVVDSIFKDYIDESITDYKDINIFTCKKIYDMIMRGKDNNGNKIKDNDLLYLRQMYPGFIEYLMLEFQDEFMLINDNRKAIITRSVSKNGKTRSIEITDDMKDTLNWDEAYIEHEKAKKTAATIEKVRKEREWEEKVSRLKNLDWEKSKITEEEYFDPQNTDILHMGRMMSIDEERKTFNNSIKLWMSQENAFPVSLSQFQPFIDYLSSIYFDQVNDPTKNFDKLEYFYGIKAVSEMIQGNRRFPLKIIIPILTTVKAQFRVMDCHTNPDDIPDELFEIPKDYKYGEVYFMNVK